MLPASSLASLVMILQLFTPDYGGKTLLYEMSTILYTVIFTGFVFIVMEMTQRFDPFKPKIFLAFWIMPMVASIGVVTDPWFHLFNKDLVFSYSNIVNQPIILANPSILNLVWLGYSWLIGMVCAVLLFKHYYGNVSKRLATVFISCTVPVAVLIFSSYFIDDLNVVPVSEFCFVAAGVTVYIYSLRYGIFDLAPASQKKILDDIEDIIAVVDNQGKVTNINQQCEVFTGRKKREVLGKSISGLFSFTQDSDLERASDGTMKHPKEITSPNGQSFEVTVTEFNYGHPNKVGRMIVLHDLTERKELEEAMRRAEAQEKIAEGERRYRTVVDNQTEAIVSFRPDGHVTFMNQVLEKNLDKMGVDANNLNIYDYPAQENDKDLNRFIANISLANPVGEFEQTISMPDSSSRIILWRAKGIYD